MVGMVLLPVGGLAWLGARSERYEAERSRMRLATAAADSLRGISAVAAGRILSTEGALDNALDALTPGADFARELARANPLVRQVFRLDGAGALLYPDGGSPVVSTRELEFLDRTRGVWEAGLPTTGVEESGRRDPARGRWHTWVWGAGVSYLYWREAADGSVEGVEVEGAAILADLIADLPETPLEQGVVARVILAGPDGEVLYQWGAWTPPEGDAPLAVRRLEPPLGAWTLSYHAPLVTAGAGGVSLVASIAALALVLAAGGLLLWRESSREAREAGRRVSFVNHVSHELKTPLTNIRMYAELLQNTLERKGRVSGAETREKIGVIVDESRRLSRLIHNVLTFARRDRGTLEVNRALGVVDEVVAGVLQDFRPRLEAAGIRVEHQAGAPARVWVDTDAVEQILANLVGNVEKYAAVGGHLEVVTSQTDFEARVVVSDRGPGIATALRERVFEPFYRVSNRLSDGVAGTGIGLTIARDLARLHGGDLVAGEPEGGRGARFVLTLGTTP